MRFYRVVALALTLGILACELKSERQLQAPARDDNPVAPAPAKVGRVAADQASVVSGEEGKDPSGFGRPETDPTVLPTMIIRSGQASVEVDSLEIAVGLVKQLAERVGGYLANTAMQAGHDQLRSATLEVKVPAARFEEAVSGLNPIGKVEAVNITAEDVGEEFTDVTARVANARRLEARLIELLATRTGKLQDVLQVERELARVREEIERYEGRLRYLKTRAAVSTLSITVHEKAPILAQPGQSPIAEAFRQAWRNFVGFSAGLIASLGTLVPLGVLLAGTLMLVRTIWRRRAGVGGGV